MASGSYANKKPTPQEPVTGQLNIPLRTRALTNPPAAEPEEEEEEQGEHPLQTLTSKVVQLVKPSDKIAMQYHANRSVAKQPTNRIVDEYAQPPLQRHRPWLQPLIICLVISVVFSAVLISAGMFQRPGQPQLVNYYGGQVYSVQVGGNALVSKWQGNGPLAPQTPLPTHSGPYSVLGKPTLSAAFMNQVLAAYGSPAAGKGQKLYDLGAQYGIDPAFALAFFLHESSFGKAGEARSSLSLGNLRCIPNFKCQDGYAWFNTWEDGFEAWYKLIRNLYVAYWGLTTVDLIIPKYAPTSDNNNEAAYIASVKHSLDVWHGGQIFVS